ncbi:MAG: T9SS type A sorting domain-containing protein [Bacteroidia bacterium]
MTKKLTLALVLAASLAQAQYYQHWYNRSLLPANSSNETFYDGMRTRVNYGGGNPTSYYHIGYGATIISPFGALLTDEARFVRTSKTGAVTVNTGTSFADNNTIKYHLTYGHAICEINNGLGTGGYLAVGNVASNFINASSVPGGSDGLFYKVNNSGTPTSRYRFDANGGAEYFTDIIASNFTPGTYYVCGYAHYGNFENVIVMSIQVNGTVNWFKTYQFDPTWPVGAPASADCRAYGIAEDINTGNLMVVGYIHDQVPAPNTGTDGLVFVLNNAGVVQCAQSHHVFDDDQYHDVKQKANGNFAICGFVTDGTGATSFSHTWLSEMSITCGNFTSTRYDHLAGAGNINQSKGYSIIERLNTANINEYYIAGPDFSATGGMVASVNKITATGTNPPVAWYDYAGQSGSFSDDAYGIDFATAAITKPGLVLFSNTNVPVATAPFNDSYMLKAYFNGATCINRCPANILIQTPVAVAVTFLPNSISTVYKRKPLIAQVTNYTFGVICSQNNVACGSNARDNDAEELSDLNDENNFVLYPNPAEDMINLALMVGDEGAYTVTVIDITGRTTLLADHYLSEGEQIIPVDLSGLAKGIYTMMVSSNNQTFTKKFVVK